MNLYVVDFGRGYSLSVVCFSKEEALNLFTEQMDRDDGALPEVTLEMIREIEPGKIYQIDGC